LSGVDVGALTNGRIGTSSDNFRGTFDGRGHKLRGFTSIGTSDYTGLFGEIQGDGIEDEYLDGVIENVVIEDFEMEGLSRVGALVGESHGTVREVTLVRPTVRGDSYVGGAVGRNFGVIKSVRA